MKTVPELDFDPAQIPLHFEGDLDCDLNIEFFQRILQDQKCSTQSD